MKYIKFSSSQCWIYSLINWSKPSWLRILHGIDHWALLPKQLPGDHIGAYLENENTLHLETSWPCCSGIELLIFSAFSCALRNLFRILSIDEDLFFSNFICAKYYHGQKRLNCCTIYTLSTHILSAPSYSLHWNIATSFNKFNILLSPMITWIRIGVGLRTNMV